MILVGLASFVLVPRVAQAIDILDVDRSVSITACIFDPIFGLLCRSSSDIDSVGYGRWTSALSDLYWAASQDSLVTQTELSGTGTVVKDNTLPDGGRAETRYHVVFAVAAATPYAFSVDNLEAAGCYPWSPTGSVTLERVDPSDPSVVLESLHSVHLARSTDPPECVTLPGLSVAGALAPGTYALEFRLGVAGSRLAAAPGTARFALVLTPGPEVVLTPEVSLNAPGGSHTVSAQVLDASGQPKPGASVAFSVVAGPNEEASGVCTFDPGCATDSDGFVYFTYQSDDSVCVDQITATSDGVASNTVLKFWDADCNENESPDTCDVSCDGFDGQCAAFAGCGSSLDTNGDLVPDECNAPPNCTLADAEPNELWPPNHSFTPVVVQGVTDEDGDPVVITITSIRQDEPLVSQGSGNFSPDGSGVGTDTAPLRAERETPGDGRVYHVGFSADDGRGGSCTGTVMVCVPPNMQPGHACVDQGAPYDSTVFAGGKPKGACGLGFELVLLAPLLARLARKRGA